MNITEDDRQKIVVWAGRHPKIEKVWLYGSRARGDNKPDSDIDLAIQTKLESGDSNTRASWVFWHSDYKEKPDLHLSAEVHLEWYRPNEGLKRVGKGVEEDGVLLFVND